MTIARVTSEEVLEIVSDDVPAITNDKETDLTAFIKVANRFVTKTLTTLNAETLKDIELYLSAHFACLKYKVIESETISKADTSYKKASGEGLKSTHYGQTAIVLDTTNTLKNLADGKITPTIDWLGTYEGDETEYEDTDDEY